MLNEQMCKSWSKPSESGEKEMQISFHSKNDFIPRAHFLL